MVEEYGEDNRYLSTVVLWSDKQPRTFRKSAWLFCYLWIYLNKDHLYYLPMGIPEGLVRLSCGIEDADDLIVDLEQVFAHLESNMQVSK